jgi:membrane protease YdiL (CAAX protease family)
LTTRQRIALIMPIVIIISMVCVFQLALFIVKNRQLAWYMGFIIYWPIWGIVYPILLIGKENVASVIKKKAPKGLEWIAFIIPPIFVLLGTLIIRFDPSDVTTKLILVGTSFATGILEEILWRGIFVFLFPKDLVKGYIIPVIWFGLWHIAPGSVSNVPMVTLVIGAIFMGSCWGLLAYSSKNILWSSISHILTGIFRSII